MSQMSSTNNEEISYSLEFGLANHLVQIACFIFYENWASRGKVNHSRPIYLNAPQQGHSHDARM